MGRPAGVTILVVVMIAAGIGFAAMGFIFFFMGSTGATATASTSGARAAMFAALGAAAGVIFLLFGGLHVVLAIGIFRMRNLARVLTIFLFILIGAGACLGSLATLLSYSHIALEWNVSLLALDALALWYLLRPETKKAFHA
jgi:nitrate reductase gamma subunit